MKDDFTDLKDINELKAEETAPVKEDNGRLVVAAVMILVGLALSVGILTGSNSNSKTNVGKARSCDSIKF